MTRNNNLTFAQHPLRLGKSGAKIEINRYGEKRRAITPGRLALSLGVYRRSSRMEKGIDK
jgi:hypothetical protein